MKTVHPHSVEAYRSLNLSERQKEVIRALSFLGEATDLQIADYLEITINRVTGRITELTKRGIVIEVSSVKGKYNKRVRISRLKDFSERLF